MLISNPNLFMQKLKENSSGSEKKSSFPINLIRSFILHLMTVNTLKFIPVLISLKQISRILLKTYMKNCYPWFEKNILIKGECNKWYNSEIKLARHNTRHAENKRRQDKANEQKHNEFQRFIQMKCELDTSKKALNYKKLKNCGSDLSRRCAQLNIFLGKSASSTGKNLKDFLFDKK